MSNNLLQGTLDLLILHARSQILNPMRVEPKHYLKILGP
ncbi:hypothetical protein SBA3_4330004 [Candidatus Sulfopaludibacter sp. SbA3]|nr:hypothetical protein SBA3_4330004 [Candidatus Sulfopaludibacter sp. SbA3]